MHSVLSSAAGQLGLKVAFYLDYNLFGEERDMLIEQSKVVLNVHFYPQAALEVHRIEYLLAKGKCVVSERSSDPALDSQYEGAVLFVDGGLENLAREAVRMVTPADDTEGSGPHQRQQLARRGLELAHDRLRFLHPLKEVLNNFSSLPFMLPSSGVS
uniref:Uncharacterized protein n=1 Tax=Fibrocapsa japonica TaxID=94617 RepID=A0A7S2USD8_9STRA